MEQVYEHELLADADGTTGAALVNDRLGLAVGVRWRAAELPCFFQWLNLRSGSYAVGLEPSTHHVAGDAAARRAGTMIWLEPGETRVYRTSFRVHRGAEDFADLERYQRPS